MVGTKIYLVFLIGQRIERTTLNAYGLPPSTLEKMEKMDIDTYHNFSILVIGAVMEVAQDISYHHSTSHKKI